MSNNKDLLLFIGLFIYCHVDFVLLDIEDY